VPWASRGWDNAEKDGGRKRHIAVDATGLVLAWADAGYADKLATWAASLKIQLEIVRKRDAHAFEVLLPRSWVVERPVPGSPLTVAAPATTNGCSKATSHGPMGHGHPDNPAPRHPEAVTTKSSTHLAS
jgi:transposase